MRVGTHISFSFVCELWISVILTFFERTWWKGGKRRFDEYEIVLIFRQNIEERHINYETMPLPTSYDLQYIGALFWQAKTLREPPSLVKFCELLFKVPSNVFNALHILWLNSHLVWANERMRMTTLSTHSWAHTHLLIRPILNPKNCV